MTSISVRVVDKTTILLKWVFLDLKNYHTLGLVELYKKVTNKADGICKAVDIEFVSSSSTFSLNEEIRGDLDTDVVEIFKSFGMRFFTIHVAQHKGDCGCNLPSSSQPKPNAFQVLMQNARNAASDDIPTEIPESTNMDKLHNTILRYLTENKCNFPGNIENRGKTFVKHLTSLLWYIDGHHTKINEAVSKESRIPEVFSKKFSGFNMPQLHRHRKRHSVNITASKLEKLCIQVKEVMQSMHFIQNDSWKNISFLLFQLLNSIDEYAIYLQRKCKLVKVVQSTPRSNFEEKANVVVLQANKGVKLYALQKLDNTLKNTDVLTPICVREELPVGLNRKKVYTLTQVLQEGGLSSKCVYYVYNTGGPKPNLHFVWRINETDSESDLINKCCAVIRKIEREVPIYERRITKREFLNSFGFVADPFAMRGIFRELTRDQSAASSMSEREIDKRFNYAVLSEDPGILVDLRHTSPERKKDSFRPFFVECEQYLQEDIGVAVQERRHGQMLYLAKAVSIKDLHSRVKERMPEGANIPSVKWLRYQFQPLNPKANTSKYYKGNINVKMMVQK
jgi:hypothetical protein